MLKFQTTNRNNPCPLCDDVSGDCRSADNGLLFCHSFIDKHQDPAHPDWLYIRPDKSGVWGLFTKRREKENYSRDHWVERSRQLKAEREKEKAARAKAGLSLTERDRALRLLSSEMGLTDADRQRLRDRGLTDDQIKAGLFFSYRPGAKVSDRIPENLPGIRYGKLAGKHSGIGCVAFNSSGQAIGYQIRLNDITDGGKYRWGYGQVSSHLPNHELPLNVARAENPKNQDIGLTEGILKPYVTDCRLQVNCIGAAGGNHSGSPEQLRVAINDLLQENSRIVIFSDAGDILNPNILKQQQKTISLLTSWGHGDRLCFGWWGQVTKDGLDCDEIDPNTVIEYLTPDEFLKMIWVEQTRQSWRKSKDFTASIELNQKYLDYKDFQDNKLYFINSGLGSGKSTNNRTWINENREWLEYQRVFYLGYRNNLLLQECAKLTGLIHIHQFSKEDKMMLSDPTLWAALCLDSLIKFQAEDFDNAVIILDEIVSVIKHLLFSNTEIKKYREKVIYLFSEAIKRARMVICLDGNLADWVVKFMGSLAPDKEIVTIENTYQSERPELFWIEGTAGINKKGESYLSKNDYKSILDKIADTVNGAKVICSDSQKCLETIDSLLTAMGKKTLRVDAKTSGTKEVRAFLADPDRWLRDNLIDYLLYSPTAESGLDIPITDYFKGHYCLFFGVLDVDSTLQMIARIRDILCPKFFWAREYSIVNQDDFQSPDPNVLARCLNERLNLDLERVLSGQVNGAEIKGQILETYQRAPEMYVEAGYFVMAQWNFERANYRECLLERLTIAGYQIISNVLDKGELGDSFKEIKKIVEITDAEKVFNAEIKPDKELSPEKLEDQYSQRKAKILESLPGIENDPIWSPDFLLKILHTDRQLISQTRRYWLLTNPSVNQRLEQEKFKKAYDRFFDDRYSMPWLDRNDWGKVWALGQSGILDILNHPDPDKPWSASDPEIQTIIQNCKRKALRLHLGYVGKTDPMQYVGRLLRMVGARWQSKQVREEGDRRWEHRLNRSTLETQEWAAIADAMTRKWAKYLSTDLAPITWEPSASYHEKSAQNLLNLAPILSEKHAKYKGGLSQSRQDFEPVTPESDFSVRGEKNQPVPICTENLTQNGDSTMTDNQPPVSPDFAPGDRVIFFSVLHGAVLTEIVRITDGGLFALKSGNVCGRNVLKRVG